MAIRISHYGEVTRFDLARSLGGRGRYWTTAYYVDGLLIDSGPAHCAGELQGALQDLPVRRILNTHTHEDHIGANGRLQAARPGLEIRVHPLGLPVLADPRAAQPLHPYRRLFWGWPQPSTGLPLEEGAPVEGEHTCFQVLYTPGHSADHLCLYETERGWLFSGDLFVGGRDRAMRAGSDVYATITSLRRMAALPARTLFPGSARVREDPPGELAARADYLEELGGKILALHQQGAGEAEIARRVLGGPLWIEWVTLGHFSRRWLVRAYLQKT